MSTENCTIDLGCKLRNPLFHSGTSQRERLLAALNPDYVKADEHTFEDLLIFAAKYAEQLNYYGTGNTISGNWISLIESDPTIVLAKISVTRVAQLRVSFEDKVRKLLVNYGSNLQGNVDTEDFRSVLNEIVASLKLLDDWYNLQAGSNPLRPVIEEFIAQRLSDQVTRLIRYDLGAEDSDIPSKPSPYTTDLGLYYFITSTSVWAVNPSTLIADNSIYNGLSEEHKINNAIDEIRLIFNVVYQALSQIVSMAGTMLAKSLETADHKPHIALFITFLRLFRYAQDDLNKFTQKHLDYYYKEVLRLSEKKAVPDRVFLIFELAQNVDRYLLSEGTEFEAGDDLQGNEVTFASTREVVLNRGTINTLNTVFTEYTNGEVSNIYAANGANTKNGLGEEPLAEGKYWPLLGESQKGISVEDRTMQNTHIGFAISTPLLLLRNGTRIITVKITPLNSLEIRKDDIAAIETDILNSLRIQLSSTESYITKKPNRILINSVPFENTGNLLLSSIEIEILLTKQDPEVIAYNATVLGETYNTTWPLLKCIFDNQEDSVKPYTIKKYDPLYLYKNFLMDAQDPNIIGDEIEVPYNTYVLQNGGIYKLIVRESQGETPESNPSKWERIENVEDLIADLDASSLEYNPLFIYRESDVVKINGVYHSYSQEVNEQNQLIDVWTPIVNETSYGYKHFKDIRINNIFVSVDVQGISNLILHSEDAALDPNKPFTPFGSNPDIGSPFYIGNTEIFQKQLSSLNVNIIWDKLPEKNFKNYYIGYEEGTSSENPTTTAINNSSFKMNLEILDKGKWSTVLQNQLLFNTKKDENTGIIDINVNAPDSQRTINIDNPVLQAVKRDPYIKEFDSFNQELAKGFIRFSLQRTSDSSVIRAFGHKERPLLFTERIINKSATPTKFPNLLPNEPFTPIIKECTVDYKSNTTIQIASVNPLDFKNRVDQFFHIEAFGQSEIHRQLLREEDPLFIVPQFNDEGTMYVGLGNIAPLQNITLLFQFKEGTEDTSIPFPVLSWSYLSNNLWYEIPKVNIVADSTNKFVRSGIVEISLPEEMTNDNTLLPSGLLWLKLSAADKTTALNKVLTVSPQAVEAEFKDNENDLERLKKGLAANTIQDLKSRDAEIDTVLQPFNSFGGRVKEESTIFYNRASERLRHKSRAIEIWDYERLVLENFPDVYRTKCLNHTSTIKGFSSLVLEELLSTETQPGFVTMVVIPQLRDFVTQEIFEPKVGIATIADIKSYLLQYVSPFVQLEVENALYERVKAQFEVVFKPGFEKAFYSAKLNEDINQFLAPWAFDSTKDITFGGRLQKSVLINFIEERPYVDFVLHFHLLQQSCIGSDTYSEVEEAQARTSRSVLSSAGTHLITALDKEEVVCDDGIGSMIVMRSFITR